MTATLLDSNGCVVAEKTLPKTRAYPTRIEHGGRCYALVPGLPATAGRYREVPDDDPAGEKESHCWPPE